MKIDNQVVTKLPLDSFSIKTARTIDIKYRDAKAREIIETLYFASLHFA